MNRPTAVLPEPDEQKRLLAKLAVHWLERGARYVAQAVRLTREVGLRMASGDDPHLDEAIREDKRLHYLAGESTARGLRAMRTFGLLGGELRHLPKETKHKKRFLADSGLFANCPEGEFEQWLQDGMYSESFCWGYMSKKAKRWLRHWGGVQLKPSSLSQK
jgi:hypothetical protein